MIWTLLVNVAFGVVLLGCFPVALVLILRRARGPARVFGAVGVIALIAAVAGGALLALVLPAVGPLVRSLLTAAGIGLLGVGLATATHDPEQGPGWTA